MQTRMAEFKRKSWKKKNVYANDMRCYLRACVSVCVCGTKERIIKYKIIPIVQKYRKLKRTKRNRRLYWLP